MPKWALRPSASASAPPACVAAKWLKRKDSNSPLHKVQGGGQECPPHPPTNARQILHSAGAGLWGPVVGYRTDRLLLALLCRCDQRPQGLYRHAQSTAGEAVNVGLVDTDDLALRVEPRAAAAPLGGGCVVNQFVANHISQVSAGRGRTDQRKRRQLIGGADVVAAES